LRTAYYNHQVALQLDERGYVTSIIHNSYDNMNIKVGDSAVKIFKDADIDKFYEHLSRALNGEVSMGFQVILANNQTVFMFIMKTNNEIVLFSVCMEEEIVKLFDEMMEINNEQIKSIRDLYKKIAKHDDEDKFLEEIMLMNNALINTRRELSHKNKELETLNKELELTNLTDYLTKLHNRRCFFKEVKKIVKEKPHQLVMMDINFFKLINDKYGHNKGDELLIFFAEELKKRITDCHGKLYRLGGDEFACLIPLDAKITIEKIIQEVDELIKDFDKNISIAYGNVIIDETTFNSENPIEDSMHKADQLMYKMKIKAHKDLKLNEL